MSRRRKINNLYLFVQDHSNGSEVGLEPKKTFYTIAMGAQTSQHKVEMSINRSIDRSIDRSWWPASKVTDPCKTVNKLADALSLQCTNSLRCDVFPLLSNLVRAVLDDKVGKQVKCKTYAPRVRISQAASRMKWHWLGKELDLKKWSTTFFLKSGEILDFGFFSDGKWASCGKRSVALRKLAISGATYK